MVPKSASVAPPAFSPEVLAFAEEKGATTYLPVVLEMTRRVFGGAPVTAVVEHDPELEDWRQIAFEVELTSTDVDWLVKASQKWSAEIIEICPKPQRHLFIYVMVSPE
jgi:hypothetical protein